MSRPFLATLQEVTPDSSSTWIVLAVVLVILFFIVVIIGVGLTIFFIMRKRSKARASAGAISGMATGSSLSASPDLSLPEVAPISTPESPSVAASSEFVPATDQGISADAVSPPEPEEVEDDFDPSRTVAISREPTVAISYGKIKFVSGVLSGQEFEIKPEGSYIGREGSLSQIVVSDPRISKRHLWIGVREGAVTVVDQESRNGTFVNDPRSERVTETKLDPGDTVIMGESDVARFEYNP